MRQDVKQQALAKILDSQIFMKKDAVFMEKIFEKEVEILKMQTAQMVKQKQTIQLAIQQQKNVDWIYHFKGTIKINGNQYRRN